MKNYVIFLFALAITGIIGGCAWRGGDRTIYPLPPTEDMTKYQTLSGTWEGRLDQNMDASAQLSYLAAEKKFRLELTIYTDDKTLVVPPLQGTFTELNGETYFCASVNVSELEKELKDASGQEYVMGPLLLPVSFLLKVDIRDNVITAYALYFAKRDKDSKFMNKLNAAMIYDPEAYLLLNSPAQIREFIEKKQYDSQVLVELRRKAPEAAEPAPGADKKPVSRSTK